MGLKIAVAGKGGCGKTTISALLAKILSDDGRKVLLVDLDSDPNLANALGVPSGAATPLAHRRELIAERTGSTGEPGGMFLLNPNVADLIESHALKITDRVSLIPVGTIESAGEGCFCPQTAFVRALVARVVLKEDESVILDLEAGLESFGRSAVEGLDLLLIVVEPGKRSMETARRILPMLPDLGIRNTRLVVNKVRPGNFSALKRQLAEEGLAADVTLEYSDDLAERDLEGRSIFDYLDPGFTERMMAIIKDLSAPTAGSR